MRVSLEAEQRIDWAVACENHFIGVQSGVGDQTPMLFAGDGESVLYDCRLRQAKRIVPKDQWRFLVINSGQSAALSASSSFNDRVAESFEAASEMALLLKRLSERARLSDFSDAEWNALTPRLSATAQRRSAHFFTEMTRVLAGEKALLAGDSVRFGALMNASCQSSIDQYETGTNLLIELVRHLQAIDGVFGARFSGSGTRGCVVALIEDVADRHILNDLEAGYHPTFASTRINNGHSPHRRRLVLKCHEGHHPCSGFWNSGKSPDRRAPQSANALFRGDTTGCTCASVARKCGDHAR